MSIVPHGTRRMVCPERATHLLSLRMRRDDTGADWAPNLPAYFCEEHATFGARIRIEYEPTGTGMVEVEVFAQINGRASRTTKIGRRGGVRI